MNHSFINRRLFGTLICLLIIPIVLVIMLAFYYNDGVNYSFSFNGFKEIFTSLRLGELIDITKRALIVSIISTGIAFIISYLLVTYTSFIFQSFFLIAITLPFLINESVRVFSWQYVLSENGVLNNFLSFITRHNVSIFNASNNWNIYLIMIITCIPCGIFICSESLKTIPKIYWSAANDLSLRPFSRMVKIAMPLSKFAIIASLIVIFFISFSLSSEVNYLGGATKLSTRNFTLSLMSASKFQAIFSLGFFILFILFTAALLFNALNNNKQKAI